MRERYDIIVTQQLIKLDLSPFQKIPSVPPPPPIDNEDDLDKDNEALHSMLIAWYMSGYHTGYYQVNNCFFFESVSF